LKDTFNDISRQIFYDVAQKDEQDVDIVLSNKKDFPYFVSKSRLIAILPIPRLVEEKFYLQGFIFDDYEKQKLGLWSFYLASIYHMGAHVAISNFDIYKGWSQAKTPEYAQKVIDFIEDFRVECYLKENFSAPAQIIEDLDSKYVSYFQGVFSKDGTAKRKFSSFYRDDDSEKFPDVKARILEEINDSTNLIECAEFVYENRQLLNQFILPYHDRVNEYTSSEIFKPIKFNPSADFEKNM